MSHHDSSATEDVIDFFVRNNLTLEDRDACHQRLMVRFPDQSVEPVVAQGFCSYTLVVGLDTIVQFRPSAHKLDLAVEIAARAIYESYVPFTEFVSALEPSGLLMYTMKKIDGMSLKDFRMLTANMEAQHAFQRRLCLCETFADFVARSWQTCERPVIPMGKVGSSLESRLQRLSCELPPRFRPTCQHILQHLSFLSDLPHTLNHGDLVASNILLDASSGRLTGVVDWAEAEILPFGMCLYGIEEILGFMTSSGFVYHAQADELRLAFWERLISEIPQLSDSSLRRKVLLSRDCGVLLWHGYAWDNGAINRVVEVGTDDVELQYLDAFLLNTQSWDTRTA